MDGTSEHEHDQPLAQRTDPHLILEAVNTGIDAIAAGFALAQHIGKNDPPPAEPSPPEVILPPGVSGE